VRSAAVEIIYQSLLQGWGNSSITICDVDETVDLTKFGEIEDPAKNLFIVCDGAHRLAALALIMKNFPNKMSNFKVPCSYIGKIKYDDRIAYSFGNLIKL
jgi:hypothetical protein